MWWHNHVLLSLAIPHWDAQPTAALPSVLSRRILLPVLLLSPQ
jgi:hypothetical protein